MDMSIEQVWSLKEEPCRGNNWRNQEVIDLINAIKTNNLMKGCPSGNQLGHLVEPLLGFTRTAFQITGKLKNLRKSYLRCERRGRTPAALRDCPYYDMLSEIYINEEINDSRVNNSLEVEQDIKVSSERGIELMFNIIKELNLSSSITLQSFSGKAVRLLSKMLIARGVCASVDQVKSTLVSLRKTYIEIRHGKRTKENSSYFRYYDYLHSLWGTMPLPDLLEDNIKPAWLKTEPELNGEDYWSNKETVALLTFVKNLNLARETLENCEEAAKKLQVVLRESGYDRTSAQIVRKLNCLKNIFDAVRAKSPEVAEKLFTLYRLYDDIFGSVRDDESEYYREEIDNQNSQDESVVLIGRTKHSRSRAWSDDETLLMLKLLEELNLTHHIAHRLSFEVAGEVVEPLRKHGYNRSAMQVQIKLRNLRKSYYSCIRAGCTENAIAECPFYHKLDVIFKRPEDRKKFEPVDDNYVNVSESYNDHCYFNALSRERPKKLTKLERSDEEDYDNSEVWLPVETICDEDSTIVEEQEETVSVFGNEKASSFEEIDETETCGNNEENSGLNDLEDPLEESVTPIDDDTGQYLRKIDNTRKNTNREQEKPGPSREPSIQRISSNLDEITRKSRKKVANPYSLKAKRGSSILRSMRIVMAEVLRHEKLLQRQHHVWMERQFEMQRKHDRDQRELLIKELREFRKSITSAMPKPQNANNRLN